MMRHSRDLDTLLVIMSWIDQGMPETPEELAGIIDTLYYRRNF